MYDGLPLQNVRRKISGQRRERQTTANQILIEVSPNRSCSDSALIVLVALDPTEIMKNCSDSQIITDLMHKSEKQEKPVS